MIKVNGSRTQIAIMSGTGFSCNIGASAARMGAKRDMAATLLAMPSLNTCTISMTTINTNIP